MARKTNTVRMHHAKANRYYDAPRSAVPFWEARGWKQADDTPAKTTVKAVEKKQEA